MKLAPTALFAALATAAAAAPMWRAFQVPSPRGTDFDAGFDISAVVEQAKRLASHSWEYGTLAEALLELYSPEYAVYCPEAFPNGTVPTPSPRIPALSYASQKFNFAEGTLSPGDGANGDPASLGVSAILLSPTNDTVKQAASKQLEHLFAAPRFYNGAISQRDAVPELWADGMVSGSRRDGVVYLR